MSHSNPNHVFVRQPQSPLIIDLTSDDEGEFPAAQLPNPAADSSTSVTEDGGAVNYPEVIRIKRDSEDADVFPDSDSEDVEYNHNYPQDNAAERNASPPPPVLELAIRPNEKIKRRTTLTTMPVISPMIMELLQFISDTPPQDQWKRRRDSTGAARLTSEHAYALEASFGVSENPKALTIIELMNSTGLTRKQIQEWFRSRRNKRKRSSRLDNNSTQGLQGLRQGRHNGEGEHRRHGSSLVHEGRRSSSSVRPPTTATANERLRTAHPSNSQLRSHSQAPSATVNEEPVASPSRDMYSPPQPPRNETGARGKMGDKIEERRNDIQLLPPSDCIRGLKKCEARVNCLIKLFHPKFGMKRQLLSETMRIKEMSTKTLPFTKAQILAMTRWREMLIGKMINRVGEDEERVDQLNCVDATILSVWLPILLYGTLLNLSLMNAIQDFTFNSRGRSFSTMELTIPGIIRCQCPSVVRQ